jgi:hypothetical protein
MISFRRIFVKSSGKCVSILAAFTEKSRHDIEDSSSSPQKVQALSWTVQENAWNFSCLALKVQAQYPGQFR